MKPPIIFFNIGWMKHYRGNKEDDKLLGGFRYIIQNETGHEQYNFLPHRGYVYGYAPIRWDKKTKVFIKIDINKLGADPLDESIDGVTVVFISKDPTRQKTYIVGWYKNATVYRTPQELVLKGRELNGDRLYYICRANEEDVNCIRESERMFVIPTAQKEKGGYGMSTIWYASKRSDIQEEVLDYIAGKIPAPPTPEDIEIPSDDGSSLSQEEKKCVEETAIDTTTKFYRQLGFHVQSVERDNCGWDLTASNKVETFYVEVKGTARKDINFQLTPNEYEKLRKYWRKYKIAVVTKCLGVPELKIYSIWHDTEKKRYFGHTDNDKPLQLTEKITVYAIGSLLTD